MRKKKKIDRNASQPGFKPEPTLRGSDPYDRPYAWDFEDLEEYTFPQGQVTGNLRYALDLGNEVRSTLKMYNIPESSWKNKSSSTGMEVGDDRVDISKSPSTLALSLVAQERVLGMKTSARDTFISSLYWNFCEVTSTMPAAREQSFHYARKTGDFSNLGFVDTITLRIIIDATKSDMSHSSTAVGKASMLGSRLSTPRSEYSQVLHLASYVQDACLRTAHSPDPKYLPRIMGGSECLPLYNDERNLYLSVHAYRGGGYDRLYGTATEEARSCITQMEVTKTGQTPVLCNKLRDKQEYLHGTYDEKLFVPKSAYKASFGTDTPEPIYQAVGSQNRFSAVENRLVRTRLLLRRRDAEREIKRTFKLRSVLFTGGKSVEASLLDDKKQSFEARRKFEFALQANTAFRALLERKASPIDALKMMENDNFLTLSCGARRFTRQHSSWLFNGGKGEIYSIHDLIPSEDMFLREDVSTEETLRVSGIPLKVIKSRRSAPPVITTNRIGLYQINGQMEDWSERIGQSLKDLRKTYKRGLTPFQVQDLYLKDPEWVTDDTLLIERCLRDTGMLSGQSTSVVLITSDRRLANQMAITCNVNVIRLRPEEIVLNCPVIPPYTSTTGLSVDDVLRQLPDYVTENYAVPSFLYIDTGSMASAAVKYDFDRSNDPSDDVQIVKKDLIRAEQSVLQRKSIVRHTWVSTPRKYNAEVHNLPDYNARRDPNRGRRRMPALSPVGVGAWLRE